jgi:hypothetical protein
MVSLRETNAKIQELSKAPAPGAPYGLPVPGTERENRTAIYRHWRFRDSALLTTYDPAIQSTHDLFEDAVKNYPKAQCFGTRPWNPVKQDWENRYDWQTYAEVAERRKNLGAGLVEIHEKAGIREDKFGVGLWSANRAEWQITGMWHIFISNDPVCHLPCLVAPLRATVLPCRPLPPISTPRIRILQLLTVRILLGRSGRCIPVPLYCLLVRNLGS